MGGSDGTLVCRSLDCRKSRAGGGCHRAAQYAPFILPLTAVACSAIFPRLYGIVAGLAVLVLSCFVSASLPHMSIRAGVVVAVTLHEIDNAPNAKTSPKSDNKCLQNAYCRSKKCHDKILSAACAAVRQADKRRSAISRRRIKKPPCMKGGVPTLRKFCGAAVFSCKGWAVRPPVGARIR